MAFGKRIGHTAELVTRELHHHSQCALEPRRHPAVVSPDRFHHSLYGIGAHGVRQQIKIQRKGIARLRIAVDLACWAREFLYEGCPDVRRKARVALRVGGLPQDTSHL